MTTATAELGQSMAAITAAQSSHAEATAKIKGNAKAAAQQFEAMFLNTVFEQMSTGMDGEGPFGGSGALKVWRSMLTDQYAQSFARTGGIGIATQVYKQLLRQQGLTEQAATTQAATATTAATAASGATKQ